VSPATKNTQDAATKIHRNHLEWLGKLYEAAIHAQLQVIEACVWEKLHAFATGVSS